MVFIVLSAKPHCGLVLISCPSQLSSAPPATKIKCFGNNIVKGAANKFVKTPTQHNKKHIQLKTEFSLKSILLGFVFVE